MTSSKCSYGNDVIEVLESGSIGNSIIYLKEVLVDIGLPYSTLKEHIKEVKYLLLTHEHQDHLLPATLQAIIINRPDIKIFIPDYLVDFIKNLKVGRKPIILPQNYHIYRKTEEGYPAVSINDYQFQPVLLQHNVMNCAYKIWKFAEDNQKPFKILHATDTNTLIGIYALEYDLYAIEFNYETKTTSALIYRANRNGRFIHQINSIKNHNSFENAQKFLDENAGENSQVVALHISGQYDDKLHLLAKHDVPYPIDYYNKRLSRSILLNTVKPVEVPAKIKEVLVKKTSRIVKIKPKTATKKQILATKSKLNTK